MKEEFLMGDKIVPSLLFGPDAGVEVEVFDDVERKGQVFEEFPRHFNVEHGAEEFGFKSVFVAGDSDVYIAFHKGEVGFLPRFIFEVE